MPKQAYYNLPEEKRERIRSKAIKLFGELPYDEVTTRLLAKEAGIALGSLYQYFDSKDEMYIYYIDSVYTDCYKKGIVFDILAGVYPEYVQEKRFIESLFLAPAQVLEQFYYSTKTNTYNVNLEATRQKQRDGQLAKDLDAGLYQFLNSGLALSMIMYARAMGIQNTVEHRRFWDKSVPTILGFVRDMEDYYANRYEREAEEDEKN